MRIINYLSHMVVSASEYTGVKSAITGAIILFGFFFDELHVQALVGLLFLIVADFITALAAVYNSRTPVQSAKVFRSAVKVTVYYLLIASSHVSEKAIPFLPLDETIIGFLVATELVSIIENVGLLGYAVPKVLLNKIKKFRDEQ